MKKELGILNEFVKTKGLRRTDQREKVLKIFLTTEKHVSADELFKIIKKRYPEIGYTTVYRTMKLLSESNLCEKTDFGDGIVRFEHKFGHEHHDHLICIKCGRFIEVMNPEIERMQDTMVKKYGFKPTAHKLDIFGVCKKCSAK